MFDQRLLEARKKKGLTQKQLSDAAGIHPASYSAYETNKKVPPVDILVKIADALEVSIDWLCGRKTESDMSTYGDIARALVHLFQALNGRYHLKTGTKWTETSEEEAIPSYYAQITLWDEELHNFLQKAEKYEDMSKGNQDEQELYFAWLEKKLSELDKKRLWELVDDEDLPF